MIKQRLSTGIPTHFWALIIVGTCLGCGPPQVAFSGLAETSADVGFDAHEQVPDAAAAPQDAQTPGPVDPQPATDAGAADAAPPTE